MSVRIIKAQAAAVTSAELFNFIDLQRQSEEIVVAAHKEAEQILANARRDADQIRERTFLEAKESARREGLLDAEQTISRQAIQIADQQVTRELETALPALRAAAESLQAERDQWLVRWERTAVQLGVVIAEKLIQRQLSARPEIAQDMITDALRLAAGQPQLTVYLNPADLAAWGDRATQIVHSLTACGDTTLVPDHLTQKGGCRIETRHGEIDARIETMLHRIAEELVDG